MSGRYRDSRYRELTVESRALGLGVKSPRESKPALGLAGVTAADALVDPPVEKPLKFDLRAVTRLKSNWSKIGASEFTVRALRLR